MKTLIRAKRKIKMKRKHLIYMILTALAVTLTLLLSGCAGGANDLDGKNIVTFEINGGRLNYGTSSTDGKINFAYYPGTYIKDPTTFPNYSISRSGYDFTGWYTDEECTPSSKWDFSTPFNAETLTLYAGWEVQIKYSFSVNYMDGDDKVTLGSYKVSAGDEFEDWLKHANKRDGHTVMGYFSDPECSVPWDFETTHPGGDSDLDIPVYVEYIVGEWKLVDSYEKLKSAVKSGNVYLTANIDCGGEEFYVSDTFDKIFEGNGYKITNFTVNQKGTTFKPSCAIFASLGENAEIRNVSFEDVSFTFNVNAQVSSLEAKVAALAVDAHDGAVVSNVAVSGTLSTNYNGELPCVNEVRYQREGERTPLVGETNFTADITVNKQS